MEITEKLLCRIALVLSIIVGIILLCTSCTTNYNATYKVTDENLHSYYTDSINTWGLCLTFDEVNQNGDIFRHTIVCTKYSVETIVKPSKECKKYIKELREMGYSKEWATHKALVEHNIIPEDEEYLSIEED